MKNLCIAMAAAVLLSSSTGCCVCRRLFKPKPVVMPAAPACAPAMQCCPASPCGDCCTSGAPLGGYVDEGIQYAPGAMNYENSAPLPMGP